MAPTDRQQRILEWLRKVYPHEARLFESALWIRADPRIPCRARLMAHAYREVCSGLANVGGQSSRVEILGLVDKLVESLQRSGLVLKESPIAGDDPRPRAEEPVAVPCPVIRALSELVTARSAQPKGLARAQELLDRLHARRAIGNGEFTPTALRWHAMNETFVSCCHDRKRDDTELLESRLEAEVQFLEETLSSVAAGAVANLAVLDEILGEANS
jgi:hypothetical protein